MLPKCIFYTKILLHKERIQGHQIGLIFSLWVVSSGTAILGLCMGWLNMISKTKVKSLRQSPPGLHCQFVRHQQHGKSACAACEACELKASTQGLHRHLDFHIQALRLSGCLLEMVVKSVHNALRDCTGRDCLHAIAFQYILLHKRDF